MTNRNPKQQFFCKGCGWVGSPRFRSVVVVESRYPKIENVCPICSEYLYKIGKLDLKEDKK